MANKPLNISEGGSCPNAYEDGCLFNNYRRPWHHGLFSNNRNVSMLQHSNTNNGEGSKENTEFRIKWPRGQLGSLPADSEQFMMIEDLYKTQDKLQKHIDEMALNKVNIQFLRKQMDKVLKILKN